MTSADVWMPIYIGDYLADTMALNAQEHGAYLLLLMHYWRNGPLPNDDKMLAAIARVDRKDWPEVGAAVRPYFDEIDGRLHQKRMDEERNAALQNREQKKAAAKARWGGQGVQKDAKRTTGGNSSGNAPEHSNEDAGAYADASVPHDRLECPSPSPSPITPLTSFEDAAAAPSPVDPPAEQIDARTELWREGSSIIAALTGKTPAQSRALLGRWLAGVRDECPVLLGILRNAVEARPVDPIPWITGAVQDRMRSKGSVEAEIDREWGLQSFASPAALAAADSLFPEQNHHRRISH